MGADDLSLGGCTSIWGVDGSEMGGLLTPHKIRPLLLGEEQSRQVANI